MRSGVWLARGGRGIAGVNRKSMKAVQDEASPAALRLKTPEAQDLLLAERLGVLRRILRILTTRAASTLSMAMQSL